MTTWFIFDKGGVRYIFSPRVVFVQCLYSGDHLGAFYSEQAWLAKFVV